MKFKKASDFYWCDAYLEFLDQKQNQCVAILIKNKLKKYKK